MFDTETTHLITSAIPLEGLDLARLPQLLTEAYAQVVAARLGATAVGPAENVSEDQEWLNTILQLRRLAETYEGLAIFLPPDDPHREACAFVAGSAHLTLSQARRLRAAAVGEIRPLPSISCHSVGPEVSACLLFLIGGHQADAAEAAKSFVTIGPTGAHTQLLRGIAALASGGGPDILSFAGLQLRQPDGQDLDYLEVAAQRLWHKLAIALQLLCRNVLGDTGESPLLLIDRVVDLVTSAQTTINSGALRLPLRLPVEGPYHVARLLRPASSALLGSSVMSTPAPSGVEPGRWTSFLRHFASLRPFLWRNHAEGVKRGFLESAHSFALTFPTGAGKTTLTELRIAAEILRGRKVVYLAPTRALVDQVSQDLGRTLAPIAKDVVRGRFLEDFGERAGARVYVQTPEQCLAYLAHEPSGHDDIGLVVVDECHQLSGMPPSPLGDYAEQKLPSRRSIDAMWAFLSLLQLSPQADVVLISAMVRNGAEIASWLEAVTTRPATVLDLAWKPTRQVRGIVAYNQHDIDMLEAKLATVRGAGDWGRKPSAQEKRGLSATPIGIFCHTQVWNTTSSFTDIPLLSAPVALALNNYWGITANRNEVAGRLLAALAAAGVPPIVFTQNLTWTSSIAKLGASGLKSSSIQSVALTAHESALFAAAAEELGSDALVERPVEGLVGVHHGLLLLPERLAMESAFARSALRALVATPTVAQGINLPAEAVIIAGDDRWEGEAEEGGLETLAVHELLNAAGRAGRAGHFAHGLVIDIPGKVHTVSKEGDTFALSGLRHVMSLFGLPDQCFDIVDPLTQVIDRIAHGSTSDEVSQYLVHRAGGMGEDALRRVLRSALGNALRAERDLAADKQAALLRGLNNTLGREDSETDEWRELAAQTATSPAAIIDVAAAVSALAEASSWDFSQLLSFALGILLDRRGTLFGLIDPTSSGLSRILPRRQQTGEDLITWEGRLSGALQEVLSHWLSGDPILTIGEALHKHRQAKGQVKAVNLGRRFAIQAAGGIGHGVSVMCKVFERKLDGVVPPHFAAWLELLPGCFREGFDQPDKLLLFWHLRRQAGLHPRTIVHRRFIEIEKFLPQWADLSTIDDRRLAIRRLVS